MGIPDHLTCLLRNLYAGQEATVRTGHGTADWFQIGKGGRQGCILSPCLFNFYAEYIMRNVGLEEAQAGIKIAGRNINNLRYADDTTLMAESEEELKSLLMKVKETDGSRQGDSVVRYLFSMLGVKTSFENTEPGVMTTVTLKKVRTRLPRLDYDFINQPDLAQTFVVCCAVMGIPFHFKGLSSLKIKETDRMAALQKEMKKLGYVIRDINGEELLWDGERCEASMEPIDTYEDHRMALSFAPVCIKIPGLRMNNPEVVSKSYPKFWDDIRSVGFTIEETPDNS